ncbi:MAG TPA: invasion associated locus B family protein [Beijerinckiaceae bacterium]|nr:invasion associated locus B family protein [Beijerinckiaceae bacterium]
MTLSAFLAVAGLTAAPVSAQGALKATHGDWQLRCDSLPGRSGEQCILMQSLVDDQNVVEGQKVEINLVVVALKASDPKANNARKPILRVIAPLGVLLPRGLGLKIDTTEIGATGFVRCLANGCVAEVEMDDALIDKFKRGKEATFVIFLTPDEGRGLPLSLDGFEKGFAQLQ